MAHRPFILHGLLVLATLLAVAFAGWQWLGMYATQAGSGEAETTVIIAPGTPGKAVAQQLADAGAIRYPYAFRTLAFLNGYGHKLQAGEYAFPPQSSPMTIMQMMSKGLIVVRQITVPEGWTSQQVISAINTAEGLEGDALTHAEEGSILPDTYRYQRGDKRAAVLARMQKAMRDFMDAHWDKRSSASLAHSPKEALTLASIVEKETGIASERPMVASVYTNRLRIGMRLQADPTVAYGVTNGESKMTRGLSRADLERPSPYNTYINVGLPPGPICNPGRESILAVLNPPASDYLYFVADGQTGGHRFAANLAEHNRNVAAYRQIQKSAQ